MTEHIKSGFSLFLGLFLMGSMQAGGLEKGFEAMAQKDYFSAQKHFEKVLFKEPTGASFGMAKLYSIERCPYYDLDKALMHVNTADSSFSFETDRDKVCLAELGISKSSISALKNDIANQAYKALMEDPSDQRLNAFLAKYGFSKDYAAATKIKSKRAFAQAQVMDDVVSYRKFIIDYPSSVERHAADSLYALRFFQIQTASGSLDDYKLFVKESPANAYSKQAYDSIFYFLKRSSKLSELTDFVRSYPNNSNTSKAWRLISMIYLKKYSKETLTDFISTYPDNPDAQSLIAELKMMFEARFIVNDAKGFFLIDAKGNKLSQGHFDSMSEFSEGLCQVIRDEKVGYMDKAGKLRSQLIFDDGLAYTGNMALVEVDGKFGLIDRWGTYIMEPRYEEIGNAKFNQVPYVLNGKSAYYPLRGARKIKGTFKDASDFIGGTAVVNKDGMVGAIDTLGNWTIPALYDWVEENVDGYSRVKKGELYGLVAHGRGEILIPEYQAVGPMIEGRRIVCQDGVFGYIDASGQWAIPMKFPYNDNSLRLSNFIEERAAVNDGTAFGLIDMKGEYILKPKFQNLLSGSGNVYAYQDKNKWGYVDVQGKKRPAEYEEAFPFAQGVAVFRSGGKLGLIDYTFKYVFNAEFDVLEPFKNTELCIVSKAGKSGLKHRDGGIIIPLEYEKVEMLNIRYFKLLKDGVTYIFDSTAEQMVWPLGK